MSVHDIPDSLRRKSLSPDRQAEDALAKTNKKLVEATEYLGGRK